MFTRQEKILLFVLASIQFSHIVDFMILMPLGPQLIRIFSITTQQFGMLVSAYTFAAGFSGFLASFFIDRFDRKKALQLLFIGFSIGTLGCALAPTYESLLLIRSLTGFFGGVLGSLVMSIVSDQIEYQRRGTAMGIVMASFSVASILGVPFSLYLANIFDWHAPFLFLGSISLILALSLHFLLPSMQGHMTHGKIAALSTLKGIYHSPNQQKALLFIAMMTVGHFMIIPFLSPSLVLNAGLTEAQLPLIYLVGGGVSIITGPLIGRMADRFGKHVIFQIAGVLVLIPVVLLTSLGPTPLFYVLLIVAFFFMLSGGRFIPANAMVSSTVEAKNRGSFMSLVSSAQNLSSAVASSLAGAIVFTNTEQRLINYQYVGYLAVVFGLIAVWLSSRILTLESNPSAELKKELL